MRIGPITRGFRAGLLGLGIMACAGGTSTDMTDSANMMVMDMAVAPPVSPNASPEAKALLKFMYTISGKYTLTGQHNFPNNVDSSTVRIFERLGKTPSVYSTDMGFSQEGDQDSYLARSKIVKESIRQHQLGAIITICWHAVPPTTDEPSAFNARRLVRDFGHEPDPNRLETVQGQLLDEQYVDLMTPGTDIYNNWAKQVDSVAHYLKLLEDAKVPVLWRPYHEMNGSWFWWGGQHGEYSTERIYRQIYDRLVNIHGLTNLVWVWSVDRTGSADNPDEARFFAHYWPGTEYLDIVSLDVYGRDFQQVFYDSLEIYANGKPMILGEVGNPPSAKVMATQPKWALYVIWAGGFVNQDGLQEIVDHPQMLDLEDSVYRKLVNVYRGEIGLEPLSIE